MTDSIKKIAVVTSTRADWGLLLPVVKELTSRGVKPQIIATYSHLFHEMGDTIDELVADGFPPTMSVPARMPAAEAVADCVTGFSKAFRFLGPDLVILLGDRFEIEGVATAAVLSRIPIAHIAGGTVSEGAVDDKFRNAISAMASLHFPETEKGRRRLLLMGAKPDSVVTAGALGVFNTLNTPFISRKELEESIGFELGDRFLLGTYHPATLDLLPAAEQMKIWLSALEISLERDPGLKILLTFPNTDEDPTQLLSLMFTFASKFRERVKVVNSLGRVRYLCAASMASVVAGNSSSGIVEIPSLGTPVVDVGIRQKGRQCSKAVIHTPLNADSIAESIAYALSPEAKDIALNTPNPYFRASTPSIIVDKILKFGSHDSEK